MRILLTSFGVAESILPHSQTPSARLRDRPISLRGLHGDLNTSNATAHGHLTPPLSYEQMPPVDMRAVNNRFMPDYATIVLADKLVMDEESFDRLVSRPHPMYAEVAGAVRALRGGGLLELANYRAILRRNEDLLRRMLELDLQVLEQWVTPLRESLDSWRSFHTLAADAMGGSDSGVGGDPTGRHPDELRAYMHVARGVIAGHQMSEEMAREDEAAGVGIGIDDLLASARLRRRAKFRDHLLAVLAPYLRYVNANLVLARELDVGFHDWSDFMPFYRRKFVPVGQDEVETEEQASQLRELFAVPFPEFAIRDPGHLMRVLGDPRVGELRELVAAAVAGEVTFDQEFAKRTLRELLDAKADASYQRLITSFVTRPLGKIPWVGSLLQSAAEWLVESRLDARAKKDYRWYYLLSSAAGVGHH